MIWKRPDRPGKTQEYHRLSRGTADRGASRILSDGYYFGTITELLVLPEFQNRGIGSQLLNLAKTHAPTLVLRRAAGGRTLL